MGRFESFLYKEYIYIGDRINKDLQNAEGEKLFEAKDAARAGMFHGNLWFVLQA